MSSAFRSICAALLLLTLVAPAPAAGKADPKRLAGFDKYMQRVLRDWNVPGIAVGVVVDGQVVLAKGYGYRDYEQKLPVTSATLFQIASNTKLFTAVAAGLLVEEGKLDWDVPVRTFATDIKFYDAQLDNTVTLRDMLAHRTGISRHDLIWYKSDFTRRELYDRLRYLEPSQPLRQGFLYNNMMYAGVGQVIENLSGQSWEDFVRARIFTPLGMRSTVFTIAEMEAAPDHGVPFTERRDTTTLYRIPFYEEARGVGPAGSIISNLDDMTRWVTALMSGGRLDGKQVLPEKVLRATLAPSIGLPNTGLETRGWGELLNPVYGMGRWTASYRGHYLAYHGGDLPGFHSQVSCMPYEGIGVVVFVIGDHAAPLYNIVTYHVYERLLGLEPTPWSERRLKDRVAGKAAGKEGRAKAGAERVAGTQPSHPLADYAGEFEHPAYGVFTVTEQGGALRFRFHRIELPLTHFHYDRFDSPDDEQDGLWSLSFGTNPQGEIHSLTTSLDESQVTFTRRADPTLTRPEVLARYVGRYKTRGGGVVEVVISEGKLYLQPGGGPRIALLPHQPRVFRVKEFADVTLEFVVEGDRAVAIKQVDPSGEFRLERL